MKFVLMLVEEDHFARWAALAPEEQAAFFEGLEVFEAAVAARGGTVVGGEGLQSPAAARTLRPGPERTVTEGPYAESAEQVGGFYVIDVADLDTAVELAREIPDHVTVEIRPTEGP